MIVPLETGVDPEQAYVKKARSTFLVEVSLHLVDVRLHRAEPKFDILQDEKIPINN